MRPILAGSILVRFQVDGLLLLDKPKGLTSNTALQKAKRLLQAQKAGHSGSLDPLASGLLPICFGEATKFSRFLLESDKLYQTTLLLGIRTDSGDSEGKIISERPVPEFSLSDIEKALEQFRGDIFQIPSMFSALKHQGQPLYKLARQGIEIERAARPLSIQSLKLLDFQSNFTTNIHTISLEIHASKGTYVRTLVDDLGEALGCGAHVIELRRLGVGPYKACQMITFSRMEAMVAEYGEVLAAEKLRAFLLPLEDSVIGMPELILSDAASYYLRQGQPVIVPYSPTDGWVKLMIRDKGFLGVGEILEDGRVAPRRLVATEALKYENAQI